MNASADDSRRRLLRDLFQAGLTRVDGRRCVADALYDHSRLTGGRKVWVAAVGKAAASMALGAHDVLGASIGRVLVITKDDHITPEVSRLPGIELYESAHPIPDERSLVAGKRLMQWVDELPPEADPMFLISGGASSLVEVLEDGLTLQDLEKLNAGGLAQGVAIGELNARRSSLSRIKGGRLTARLHGRPAHAMFISDVPGDDPDVIGSGLLGQLKGTVDSVRRDIVASVSDAMEAVRLAAGERGLGATAAVRRFDGDAVRLATRFAHELCLNEAQVCVWGGESTVQLPPNPGRGGRNQHLALAVAKLICGQPKLALLAAGTDGTDGPTQDAGAIVDGETFSRISLAGLDADECLARADANPALAASGDLIHTGPTGTNVGDLVIGLNVSPETAHAAIQRYRRAQERAL